MKAQIYEPIAGRIGEFSDQASRIRVDVLLTLARLYEDEMHRSQYKLIEFDPADVTVGQEVLRGLVKDAILEQVMPRIVRFTDSGYRHVLPDLMQWRAETPTADAHACAARPSAESESEVRRPIRRRKSGSGGLRVGQGGASG